jgi:hypothetical protein
MPTARELLEQAEALMRRDRAVPLVDPGSVSLPEETVPVTHGRGWAGPAIDARSPAAALDDIPLLTDIVEDFDTPSIASDAADDGERSIWDEVAEEASIAKPETESRPAPIHANESTGGRIDAEKSEALRIDAEALPDPAVESELVAALESLPEPPLALDPIALTVHDAPPEASAFGLPARILDDDESTTKVDRAASAPALHAVTEKPPHVGAGVPHAADEERWNTLAEEIRMQVLQRIDIFTDTGLKEQLNARLQPIVDRASADLVAAINQHVGQLLREYVAEAIEREIEKWREEKSGA